MAEKEIKVRMVQKHDNAAGWQAHSDFIPKEGEIIIYDDEPKRIKIGDGTTSVTQLPFFTQTIQGSYNEPNKILTLL